MTKWDKIFTAALMIFASGMLSFVVGEYLMPGWAPVTIWVGSTLAGIGGLVTGVAGIFLLLTPGART